MAGLGGPWLVIIFPYKPLIHVDIWRLYVKLNHQNISNLSWICFPGAPGHAAACFITPFHHPNVLRMELKHWAWWSKAGLRDGKPGFGWL
jgi:hypothetical protein